MPNPLNGSPRLPRMSPQERELWLLSHRAPDGTMLLYRDELTQLTTAASAFRAAIDSIDEVLKVVRRPEEQTATATLLRLIRDCGRLTIEKNAYQFQCSKEQKLAAGIEIRAKLNPKKKAT